MRGLYLSAVSSFRFLEEVFVYCPVREKCKIIGHLMATAFIKYYESSGDDLFQKDSTLFTLI